MTEFVIVTGATGGIGKCLAHQLGCLGYVPVIGHRDAKKKQAQEIAKSCGGIAMVLDMNDLSTIDTAIDKVSKDPRSVAGVVIGASPAPVITSFGKITPEDHLKFWNANVVGPHYLLASLVRKCFRSQKSGSVVALLTKAMNIDSQDDEPKAMSGMGAYTISKYGLLGVMAQLHGEFPWLSVSSYRPGFTETAMLDVFDSRFLDQLRAQHPFSLPKQIAEDVIQELGLKPII